MHTVPRRSRLQDSHVVAGLVPAFALKPKELFEIAEWAGLMPQPTELDHLNSLDYLSEGGDSSN